MSDDPNDSIILRLTTTVPARALSRSRSAAGKVGQILKARLDGALEAGLDRFAREFEDPKNVERLQAQLARIASFTVELGFRADPAARELFDFVRWAEDKHGRDAVQAIVLTENLISDGHLLELLLGYITILTTGGTSPGGPTYTAEDVENFKQEAARRLLRLTTRLAALGEDTSPPLDDVEAMAAYIEDASIPEHFKSLASRALGRYETSPASSKRDRRNLRQRITRTLLTTTGSSPTDAEGQSALARFIPGLGDPTFRFLVFSYTFFIQTYILRGLIEHLPELMATARKVSWD